MLQAADSCAQTHFGPDETYGYWAQDFQHVLDGPNPDSALSQLAQRPEVMAKLYGFLGLRLTDSITAVLMDITTVWPDTLILVADRCLISERPLQGVLAEIRAGAWDQRLTRIRVDVH